ncbi:MAG: hypothetical protein MUC48_24645 [Leptolyngbya sp. Prado105]|nr:hypothetical protein [Leptolyngbya sp. Prado105]
MYLGLFFAAVGGSDFIGDSLRSSKEISAGWQNNWNLIFREPSGLYQSLNYFATMIAVGAFLFFIVVWAREMMTSGLLPAFDRLMWVILVMLLLWNNGFWLARLTFGIHEIIEDQSQNVLSIQMGQLKMSDALQDVVLTADAQNTIRALYGECQAKTGQAQIDCFNKVTDQAQSIIEQYEKGWGKGTLNGLRRWFDSVLKIREDLKKRAGEPEAIANIDPFVLLHAGIIATTDTAQQAAARQMLKGWQWAFANLIEASLLLTALTGPVAIAGSLLPIGTRPIWAWLTGLFSLGMAKLYYNIVVGLIATVIVNAQVQNESDFGFVVLLSVLAPVLSVALAAGGGLAVYRGLSNGVLQIISTGWQVARQAAGIALKL